MAAAVFRPARGAGLARTPPRPAAAGTDRHAVWATRSSPSSLRRRSPGRRDPLPRRIGRAGAGRRGLAGSRRRACRAGGLGESMRQRLRIQAEALIDLANAAHAAYRRDPAGAGPGGTRSRARAGDRGDSRRGPRRLRSILIDSSSRGRVGLRLITGWRVVIAGRPNVGKSRLLNALAGYQRAIVHSAPGTTRDVVTVATALEGWPVELADTAGVRTTDDPIEQSGIDRALRQTETADLVLKVLDRSEPLRDRRSRADRAAGHVPPGRQQGRPAAGLGAERSALCRGPGRDSCRPERGEGLDLLIAAIVAALVPMPTEPGAGVPFRPATTSSVFERSRDALLAGDPETAIGEIERSSCLPQRR